jgi:selenide, water dikinase
MPGPEEIIKLTKYAHGAGCGCKISPQVLKEILGNSENLITDKNLLVGNKTNDDAAVYDLGNGTALIATTDFFMPVVNDPFDFGRVAAANAISDVYAMGGKPTLALAILGWPVDKLPASLAGKVMDGAREVCREAGIVLAGGHSIDTTEPMFGLSVNGIIEIKDLKRNDTAREGDYIFLTKPLGTGIFTTAQKREVLKEEDQGNLITQLTTLNKIGALLGKLKGVTSMTDVTGFGLMGHLLEMANGSGLTASISYKAIPRMKGLAEYIAQGIMPDATFRNWNAYNKEVLFEPGINMTEAFSLLPDPQTNGGLLFSVAGDQVNEVKRLLREQGLQEHAEPIGRMIKKLDKSLRIVE